jgi:hypothetical protein
MWKSFLKVVDAYKFSRILTESASHKILGVTPGLKFHQKGKKKTAAL